jgi:hypothetical protein
VYGFWIEYCATLNGRFPYPFLTIMELDHRMWTYMGAAAFAFTTFALLNAVHK